MADTSDVAVRLRGLAVTNDEVSFVMNAGIRSDEDFVAQGATLSGGRPFNMWHEIPDPDSLTLRCRWQLVSDDEYQKDTEFLEMGIQDLYFQAGGVICPTRASGKGSFSSHTPFQSRGCKLSA